jgi:hypothetical protein
MGLEPRKYQPGNKLHAYLAEAAARRHITVEALRIRLLKVIIKDKMIDAILDDADSLPVNQRRTTGHRSWP